MNHREFYLFLRIKTLLLIPMIILADNLTLDNQSLNLHGTHIYEVVSLQNTSRLNVDSTYSKLILYCDSIFIDSSSGIYANSISINHNSMGANFNDVGGGGAGAGYANYGGNGGGDFESLGGNVTGHSDSLATGSIGGIGDIQLSLEDHHGGKGGGAIMVVAHFAEINGQISANGGAGDDFYTSGGTDIWDHGGGGGGSGGHIILNILHLEMSSGSMISAKGGNGGIPFEGSDESELVIPGGGGGGSGGYVTISSLIEISSEFIDVSGGDGGENQSITYYPGQDGLPGSFNYKPLSISSVSHPDPSIYYLNNEPIFQLAAMGQISAYFYEISNDPTNNVTIAQSQAIPSYGEITTFQFGPLEDGTWYLHIIPFSSSGIFQQNWAGTYQFKIGRNSIEIESQTHPDDSAWYLGQTVVLNISAFAGISKYHYEFNRNPLSIPEVGASSLLSVNSWVEFASGQGEYFLNIIPEDSSGFILDQPIRKRFNVGTQPPFNNFLQIPSIDTLILTSNGPHDDFKLKWERTQNTNSDSFQYYIEFFSNFQTTFSDTLISFNQDSISYRGSEIYQEMLGFDSDTILTHWWVHAMLGQDTLGTLNGPLPFVIMKEPYPISRFNLLAPDDSSMVFVNNLLIEDSLKFNWDFSETENNLPLKYSLTFYDSLGYVNSDSVFFLFKDTILIHNKMEIDYISIYNLMDSLNIDTLRCKWQVEAFDSINSLPSINGPRHLELAILSPPLVPFNLEYPNDNQNIFLQIENILDTLNFIWTESYNFLGEPSQFKILFEDSLGADNNVESIIFRDSTISQNKFSISYLDLFRKMDSLDIDSLIISWQVQVSDSSDSILSINGPFSLNIFKDSVNIDIPYISFQLQDSLFSRIMAIEVQSIYLNNDTLDFLMDYSMDQGQSWINEFNIDSNQNIINFNYLWDVLDEFGWNYVEDLTLRFYATGDNIFSDTVFVSGINVANLVGDYIHTPVEEVGLKANDIATLTSIFYDTGEEIEIYDIGPSTGVAPLLTVEKDGVIDFEDLATFTQMWYWSADNFLNIDTLVSDFIVDNISQFSIKGVIDDHYLYSEGFPYEISYTKDLNLSGFELKIEYNVEDFDVISFSLLNRSLQENSELISYRKHNEEIGVYMVSAWSKNQLQIPFQDIKTKIFLAPKNNEKVKFPFEIYFLPYFSDNDKGILSHSTLNLDLTSLISEKVHLSSNYPNPFNSSTKFIFSITQPSFVVVKVFDILGKEIKTLVSGYFQPGSEIISWDGRDYSGKEMGAGMYFYQLKTNNTIISKKMVLLK